MNINNIISNDSLAFYGSGSSMFLSAPGYDEYEMLIIDNSNKARKSLPKTIYCRRDELRDNRGNRVNIGHFNIISRKEYKKELISELAGF